MREPVMMDRAGKAGGGVRDLLREIDRDLAVPAMLGASGALEKRLHRDFPLVAAPLPPKDDSPESASGSIPTPFLASRLSPFCAVFLQADILDLLRARVQSSVCHHRQIDARC